ncbi:hypothetical protein AVEN_230676-1 [Araneus ventricosus]|uniref:Uncharacterized protein n=1 Tax=Araneus ventricosus TaxID=182803 RepID=A0A4Y2A2P7_ARAVE|nr:hypothetical protein AVEN_230676-1 [Araneus ventricosus]
MIQEIWCLGLDWDDPIPKQLTTAMNEWCEEIKDLHLINIPRYYLAEAKFNEVDHVQLHCFSDASKRAYGAVVYVRVVFKNGRIISNFVASKSRVAPLRTLSIPRLELMGALLAARLSSKISKYLNFPDLKAKFWSRRSLEYLSKLQPRKKWRSPQPNLQEGQLVILKEGNKPLQWNLARINKIIPGEDGLVPFVEVNTAAGVFRRAISKVVPLPLPEVG